MATSEFNNRIDIALKKIMDITHDAMIAIDQEGKITLFNQEAERLTGFSRIAVIGKPVVDVITNTRLVEVLKTKAPEHNQRQVLGNIEIITSRMPLYDGSDLIGAVAIFRDVSEVVRLAEEVTNLKEIQMTMEAVFNATKDAISVVNQEGIHILINPAYTQITGYTASEVIGKDYSVDLVEGESAHQKVLKTGLPVDNVVVVSGKTKKNIVTSAAPILVDGQIRGSVAVLHDITEMTRLHQELAKAKQIIRSLEAKYTFDDIKGRSQGMKDAIERAKIAAITPATVILRGESGTGKELFAHAIHNASSRCNAQFVRVNCAAISESLLESELFGYDEGAFTGAVKGGRMGLFERASGGTIFLDEIGEMPMSTQVKLLRVIQEREIVRVGGTKPITVDVRIISATHVDLEKAVRSGAFREDLYYRLNVIPIVIPPLRDRLEDLVDLVEILVMRYNQEYGRNILRVSDAVIVALSAYSWPGNVRELDNYLGRAVIQMRISDTEMQLQHLPAFSNQKRMPAFEASVRAVAGQDGARQEGPADTTFESLEAALQFAERHQIYRVLEQSGGNRTVAAKKLGISLRALYYKMQKYKL